MGNPEAQRAHTTPEEKTKTGDRTIDVTRPTDPTRHTSTDRKRMYLAVGRLSGLLEVAGASQFGPCAGCVGSRLGRRTGMPAASAAAKAVAGASHGLQRIHEGQRGNPGHLTKPQLMLAASSSSVIHFRDNWIDFAIF